MIRAGGFEQHATGLVRSSPADQIGNALLVVTKLLTDVRGQHVHIEVVL